MNNQILNQFLSAKDKGRPLILDGAMGSLLQQRGFNTDNNIWTTLVNESAPESIIKIHKEYINAGADIITTNTFRTNPVSLSKAGFNDPSGFVANAVNLAKKSIDKKNILIAGSNAPAEDCYQKERTITKNLLEKNHINHIKLLIDNGVDLILNETQSHFDEISIICNYCSKNNLPFILSLFMDNNLNLLSGENINSVINFILEHNPVAIGFNCISSDQLRNIFSSVELKDLIWGYYLNCGAGKLTDKSIECGISPEEYVEIAKDALKFNPAFIGSCCGSSPKHTKALKKLFDGKDNS